MVETLEVMGGLPHINWWILQPSTGAVSVLFPSKKTQQVTTRAFRSVDGTRPCHWPRCPRNDGADPKK